MKTTIIRFGLLAVALLLLIQLSTYNLVSRLWSMELIVGLAALALLAMGVYLSRFIFKPKSSPSQQNAVDTEELETLGISAREYQVLQQMALGKSNKEIADSLFISESTVKTHVSNVLIKLDAKRRTEAISIAQGKGIL